jgi:hypothetical protein
MPSIIKLINANLHTSAEQRIRGLQHAALPLAPEDGCAVAVEPVVWHGRLLGGIEGEAEEIKGTRNLLLLWLEPFVACWVVYRKGFAMGGWSLSFVVE